jgi:hypothetical protein
MNRQTNLRWNLIFLLAVLGLARPLLSITGVYSSLGGSTWASALVIMIAAVWVGIAVATCSSSPLATLTLAGALYGVLAIVLQQIIWNLVLGSAPEGTPSTAPVLVMSWASILVTNTVWGTFLGLLAAGVCRLLPRCDTAAQEGCVTVLCRKLNLRFETYPFDV